MLGGLFEGLEQGVERMRREHVNLVDDVDLAPAAHGPIDAVGDEFAGLFDLAVGRRVDLDDIRVLPRHDRLVHFRSAPGQRLGENPRHRGLAHTPRPDKEIRVRHPPLLDRARQCARHRLLTHDFIEGLGSVSAGENGVGHGSRWIAPSRGLATRTPAAPDIGRLWLLPSGPDQVHGTPAHRARSPTSATRAPVYPTSRSYAPPPLSRFSTRLHAPPANLAL